MPTREPATKTAILAGYAGFTRRQRAPWRLSG